MIPNYQDTVEQTKADFPRAWEHCHVEDDPERWDFIQLVARRLYKRNNLMGMNGKRGSDDPGQISYDAINWKGDDTDGPNVIDVVGAAGSTDPNHPPYPSWLVTNSTGLWLDPFRARTYYNYGEDGGWEGSGEGGDTLPAYESPEVGGDNGGWTIGHYLFHDYERGQQAPNPGMGVWFYRTSYDCINGEGFEAALKRHREEWCQVLNIPVDDWKPESA